MTAFDQTKCLEQLKLINSLNRCAAISELPSNISIMIFLLNLFRGVKAWLRLKKRFNVHCIFDEFWIRIRFFEKYQYLDPNLFLVGSFVGSGFKPRIQIRVFVSKGGSGSVLSSSRESNPDPVYLWSLWSETLEKFYLDVKKMNKEIEKDSLYF